MTEKNMRKLAVALFKRKLKSQNANASIFKIKVINIPYVKIFTEQRAQIFFKSAWVMF